MNKFSLNVQNISPWQVLHFKEIPSTNDYSKKNILNLHVPSLITADHQTAGRGRGAHTWEDESAGEQFLSTWVLGLGRNNPDPRWTMAIGFLIFKCLEKAWPELQVSVKPPNDIFVKDRKLAGLLVETVTEGGNLFLVIGLGLNVFSSPHAHKNTAISLADKLESLTEKTWQEFLSLIAEEFLNFQKFVSSPNWLSAISKDLISAMNRHPDRKLNPVHSIAATGSIQLDQGYLNWLEL